MSVNLYSGLSTPQILAQDRVFVQMPISISGTTYDSLGGGGGVTSINALTGVVLASGAGLVSITQVGQTIMVSGAGDGAGNVVGPPSATDLALARWSGTAGTALANSVVTLSNAGKITVPAGGAVVTPVISGNTSLNANAPIYVVQSTDGSNSATVSGSYVDNSLTLTQNQGGSQSSVVTLNGSNAVLSFGSVSGGASATLSTNNAQLRQAGPLGTGYVDSTGGDVTISGSIVGAIATSGITATALGAQMLFSTVSHNIGLNAGASIQLNAGYPGASGNVNINSANGDLVTALDIIPTPSGTLDIGKTGSRFANLWVNNINGSPYPSGSAGSSITVPASTTNTAIVSWSGTGGAGLLNNTATISSAGVISLPSAGGVVNAASGVNNLGTAANPFSGVATTKINEYASFGGGCSAWGYITTPTTVTAGANVKSVSNPVGNIWNIYFKNPLANGNYVPVFSVEDGGVNAPRIAPTEASGAGFRVEWNATPGATFRFAVFGG